MLNETREMNAKCRVRGKESRNQFSILHCAVRTLTVSAWLLLSFLFGSTILANIPGGGTGTGPNVTLVDNGSTVTLANGTVSILCTKAGATINQINYTYNNGAGTITNQLLAGGNNGGQLYWELGGFGTGSFTYTLVSDPAANGGNYAEISLLSSSTNSGTMEVHFSMLRGSTGFYVTAIWSHRSGDGAMSIGETRDNIYSGSIFNWMSVDAARNRLMQVTGGSSQGVLNAPVEVSLWNSGLYQGQYEDKYSYSADLGVQRAWGWSSVGASGKNVGLWNVSASAEYYNGGPMKRELMCHIGTTILNMHNGSHYGGGTDGAFATGEVWTKVYGPYFIYCNNVSNSITDPTQASGALYADALAQAAAEQTAWPYSWFANPNYASAANRGTVQGTISISDSGNPNASGSNLWVGVVIQPATSSGLYDFQKWMKPYQFWSRCDSNGNFTIPNVIAGSGYTLYAFGPGAAGTFQSQSLVGGNSPNTEDIPASQFSVTVPADGTNNLGAITWTPARVGATVFEIGYPNRTGDKFRHGDDYWKGDVGPNPTNPSPIWSKHLLYPFEFPSGPNYSVGQSRWSTDWNYVQPVVTDSAGNFNPSTSTITFNLASAPAPGAQASLYIALSSDYQGALILQVNGTSIAGSTGYFPAYSGSSDESDTTIRQGIHGCFSDCRTNFSGSLLHQGQNTITINMRKGGYFANHAMYDYIRLELTGYVPPALASVAGFAGNNSVLLSWPVVPGATSYNILRTTTSGNGYVLLVSGVTGPVCGSGFNNATFLDTNVVNGTTYYYVVQSANPVGSSLNSSESPGVAPGAGISTSPPATPGGLAAVTGPNSVALNWSPAPGANYYTIQRSTLVDNGGGSYVALGTITLNNAVAGTSYTDSSPSDGSTYNYFVSAANAAGTSPNSAPVIATPLPAAPTVPPSSVVVSGGLGQTNYTISWSPVSGAIGYVVRRGTATNGPFTFVMSVTETSYADSGLSSSAEYFYNVTAVNAGGVSSPSTTVAGPPGIPASVAAIPGNTTVTLNWMAPAGATSYLVKRGTSSGNETTTVATGLTVTTYTDTNLINGTTYYYVVAAVGPGGTSLNSPEVSATPSSAVIAGLVWIGSTSSTWDTTTTNWLNGGIPANYTDGSAVVFNDSASATTVAISGSVSPSLVTFANSTPSYSLSASGAGIAGATAVVKTNSGNVSFTSLNSYSGGLTIYGGIVTLPGANGSSAFTGTLGSGMVTINSGGELQFAPPGGSAGRTSSTFANNFVLNGGVLYANDGQEHLTGTISVNAATTLLRQWNNSTADKQKALLLDGVLSGSAPLNLYGTGGAANQGARMWIDNGANTFSGTVNVYPGSAYAGFSAAAGGFSLGLGANTALQFATVNLQGTRTPGSTDATELYGLQFLNGQDAPVLGALQGNGNINLADLGGATVTLSAGANNTSTIFSGVLSGTGGLLKAGTGTFTLSGANTYSGQTAVAAGTLVVSGSINSGNLVIVSNAATLQLSGSITASTLQINVGGTLSGCGTLNGNLINNGSVISACGSGNSLVISGNVTNNSTMQLLAGTGLQVSGVFVNNGVLDLITGAPGLPANFINNGVVLDVRNVLLQAPTISRANVLVAIQSYSGHGYQLQRSASLNPGSWQSVGSVQNGNGGVLNFTDTGAAANGSGFYRILVNP